jgi:DNA mismatch repair protein MutS
VREVGDQIVFLHKLLPGPSDRSYGIQVAQLAGLPAGVIARAKQLLLELEASHTAGGRGLGRTGTGEPRAAVTTQLSLFQPASPVLERLRRIDPDTMTPIQALNFLTELKSLLPG